MKLELTWRSGTVRRWKENRNIGRKIRGGGTTQEQGGSRQEQEDQEQEAGGRCLSLLLRGAPAPDFPCLLLLPLILLVHPRT